MKKNTDRSRNKGRAGKMWAGAVLLAAGLLLCGCQKGESFDAAGYVESVLDANYQGKYEEYAAFLEVSTEDAAADLEKNLDEQIRTQLEGMDEITEEGREIYKDKLKEMEKLMHYEVGEAREQEDGSFVVPVTVEPADVYQTLEQHSYDVTLEMMERGEDPDAPEGFTEILAESMQRAMDGITYGEPVEVEIRVSQDGRGAYGISDEDMQKIADAMMPR